MKHCVLLLSLLFAMLALSACAAPYNGDAVFPDDKAPAVRTPGQFDSTTAGAENSQGKVIKLAGHIVDITATDEGAVILAKWLPFPKQISLEEGPADSQSAQDRHFVFIFPGTVRDPFIPGESYDPAVAWEGNRLIVEGKIAGKKNILVHTFGEERSLLYVRARCVHVWETGEGSVTDQPDAQWAGTMGRTFCAAK